MEKVFSIVRQRYGFSPTDQTKNLDVNTAIWCIFMSVTLQAAVHLGKDYTENLRSTTNHPKKSLRPLFQVTERLITDQTEITGLSTIDWQLLVWRETTPLTDRAVHFATAKTNVFCDSVLCLGSISDEPVKAWKSRNNWFLETRYLKDLDRVDGEQMEFEWKKLPRIHHIGDEIQRMMTESKCEPEQFKGRFMYNDIDWTKRGNKENCVASARRVSEYAPRFTQGHWSCLGLGSEKKWYGTHVNKLDGELEKIAEDMMFNFAESGHPGLRGKGVKTIHFNSLDDTVELILRTVISVNQLRVYGALCQESARDSRGAGKPAANDNLESMVMPTEFPTANPISQTDAEVQGNLLREYEPEIRRTS